jgi:peroxiredoxin Q/BCP
MCGGCAYEPTIALLHPRAQEDGMLKAGERAPEFSLPDHNGRDTSLTSLLNSGSLILWFFSGFTNVVASRRIAELHADLHRQGLVIAGVSPQSPARHRRLHQQQELPFALLSDVHKSVTRMYDVNGLLGIGVRRSTYLISRGRTILGSVADSLRMDTHIDFMREAPDVVLTMPVHF